ncbi:MAG: translocation/assembly module TamB domain-containing protein [Firmicutes bacterium]|nr:translocation/assembly module TamB domain-containing protein [Bacillota bacterium]
MRALWRRRGFRRTTYALVTGLVVWGGASWTLRRPAVRRWAMGKLERVVKEETGLTLELEDIDVSLLKGTVVAHRPRLGGDLFEVERLEGSVHLGALLRGQVHVKDLILDGPRIYLNEARLKAIRLKERPKSDTPTDWQVDRILVRKGFLVVDEPAWGLPHLQSSFSAQGEGKGRNRLRLFVSLDDLRAGQGAQALQGRLVMQGEVDRETLSLPQGAMRLGRSQIALHGTYDTKTEKIAAVAQGNLDVGPLQRLFAPKAGDLSGWVDLKAEAWGQVRQPAWKLALDGRDVAVPKAGLKPGTLAFSAQGTFTEANVHRVAWRSANGQLEAQGQWKKGVGSRLTLEGRQMDLSSVANLSRVAFLANSQMNLKASAFVPGDPWNAPPLDRIEAALDMAFTNDGQDAGRAKARLKGGQLVADDVALDLPELAFHGTASGTFGRKGPLALAADGDVDTEIVLVSEVLKVWNIGLHEGEGPQRVLVPLPMSGRVQAKAQVRWTPKDGLLLAGDCVAVRPGWENARADRIQAEVSIRRDELRVENIELWKGEGRAWGELWLTWADLPKGVDQIDMCYRGVELPIEEGLRAAGLDEKEIRISGWGGGWVRLHGPYDRILMEGSAQAEKAEVYGIRIPAAEGDFSMDIEDSRLRVRNVRVGESLVALKEGLPGTLALTGDMDMDYHRRTWLASLQGRVDSEPLGLPGPRFQAQADVRLEGPWTKPAGDMELPLGRVTFNGGRLFLGHQSLEGLEGRAVHSADGLEVRLSMLGKAQPFFKADAWQTGRDLVGALELSLGPESVDTAHLGARLSDDLLRDLRLHATAEGRWSQTGLIWKGRLNDLVATFDGFQLLQEQPTVLEGDQSGAKVDLRLVGQAAGEARTDVASFRAAGRLPFNLKTPLDLRLQGSAELGRLKPIVNHLMELDTYSLLEDLEPQGAATFDLRLGGYYEDPALDGQLRLKHGRLLVKGYPQSVEDLDFVVRFQGREMLIPQEEPARGTLAQGKLTLWGNATWNFGGLENYDLRADLRDFEFRDIPEGFELQGDLEGARLQGNDVDGGRLEGTLRVQNMLYRADINLRDLILSNSLGSVSGSQGLDPDDPLARIALDLDLRLAQPWVFDTNLLKLQGRPEGSFKVQGTLAKPGLKGRMMFLPGGRVTNLLPAGDIVLERGSVDFLDPRTFNPVLDLQGRVDVTPYLVNLQIRGTLEGMKMQPTSTPSLRQDEIMAILIDPSLAPTIGTLSNASSDMSYGLAKTSSGLLTTLALADFQERVRRAFNLDRVNVAWRAGTEGNSESVVTLGWTLKFQDWKVPFVFTHKKTGEVTTSSGQFEWRFGNFVLQLGASQSGSSGLNPSGEIRHSWSPR